jgi:RNA polymerase sigma-70 factor (ECF subfamily)
MDLDGLPDDELLARTPGEPRAFAVFYARHAGTVLGALRRRTGSAELAADLTAETFATALVAAARYRRDGTPATAWLHGISRNVLLRSIERRQVEDRARRKLGMPRLELDDDLLERIDALGAEVRAEAMLATLEPDQAEAVRGRVIEEVPYPELAARLRCSEQVVRKRVSRGLAALRSTAEEAR